MKHCRGLHGQNQAVLADGETDAGSGRPAQHLGKPVVAPTADHRVLGAQRAAGNLKRRPRVVVEPAHQTRRNLIGKAARLQPARDPLEMLAALGVEVVDDLGQLFDDRLVRFHFAIQHAQRIGFGSPLAIHAHRGFDVLKRQPQDFQIGRRGTWGNPPS